MNNANFALALATAADSHPHRDCLIIDRDDGSAHETWSYADLGHWVQRFAGALAALEVAPGDRVLSQVEKSPFAVALYLGCLRLGAVYVPLNTAYTAEEVDYFLGDAEPRVYVASSAIAARRGPIEGVHVVTLDADGTGTLADAARRAEPFTGIELRRPDDIAAIVYTSGTTGRSKGAMLTHANLESNARVLTDAWGWRDDDVLLHALPIFHVHGLFVALHCALLNATPMIFQPRFDAARVAAALPRATVLMGVPTFYTRLLERPEVNRESCRRVRLFVSGSAPLTEATFAAWEARTGHRILERYGMSETMMNTSNPLHGERVPGTVGFPLPGVEARIAAPEDGRVLRPGEVGVIEVRGPNVFAGYWRMPEKTAAEFRPDGFFITGDIGVMDEAGRVSIVGRAKDLIISGGYNVYPKEIERLLDELPGVGESAVIGVPHPDFGEGVVAVLAASDPAIDLPAVRRALEGRLASFKQPKAVVHVDALPRNAMGKVQKNALRAQFQNLFAGAVS
ncbi:MAG TPA: malonyl-CoA synthase [Pseudomonadales bacterium]